MHRARRRVPDERSTAVCVAQSERHGRADSGVVSDASVEEENACARRILVTEIGSRRRTQQQAESDCGDDEIAARRPDVNPSLAALPQRYDCRRSMSMHRKRAASRRPSKGNRRLPTLPGGCPPSTIGASGLNFSVRNGKRCFPLAIATERLRDQSSPDLQNCTAGPTKELGKYIRQALEQLVPVG